MALLLDRNTIQGLLDMDKMIEILEQAFGELASGSAIMPPRTAVVDAENNGWYGFMPAQLKSMGALGVKAVTVYKDNPSKHNLPSTLATIIILDGNTGQATAVMDGGYITAMRTGAVSGLATRHLARSDSRVAGVLGTGVQARDQLWAMAAGANLDRMLVFSVDPVDAQKAFADDVAQLVGLPVEVASSAQELVESVDILALATTAIRPIIDGDWVRPGTHINAIGSHAPGVRELDTKTVVKSKLVCDHKDACLAEAGDIQIPIEEGALSVDDIYGELGDVASGAIAGRENDDEITLFKSVGLSIQDISAAYYVYQQALERGVGAEFNFS
ncbi:MAG: hypothetical protein IIB17_06340 [Chloroflexi bacterium]|nr:hypothetical protein [Chloroflexota bacterium]